MKREIKYRPKPAELAENHTADQIGAALTGRKTPPPKPKSDNYRRPLERAEVVFVNGMTRTFVGTTAIRLGKEIVINEQDTTIVISLKNVLYFKTSTVKEENNGQTGYDPEDVRIRKRDNE
jgi:hypothetical protein